MKTEAARDTQVLPVNRRLAETVTSRVRKRLRSITRLPLVYIQSDDPCVEDMAQVNEGHGREMDGLQDLAGELENRCKELQEKVNEECDKQDQLEHMLEKSEASGSTQLHQLLPSQSTSMHSGGTTNSLSRTTKDMYLKPAPQGTLKRLLMKLAEE
jgi:hypothetical protein